MHQQPTSVASATRDRPLGASPLAGRIAAEIDAAGGWLGFERFMELALYAPGLGYYARGDRQFGHLPDSGSDFVTAPELSPLFGRALARQVAQALDATDTDEVWEFGAGSGALAAQLLGALGHRVRRYVIVDLSGSLRARQQQTLQAAQPALADRVHWLDRLPADGIHGVVIGNEVLDAMPVALLHWDGERWFERGVALGADGTFVFADRPTALRPPVEGPFMPGTTVELGRSAVGRSAKTKARSAPSATLRSNQRSPSQCSSATGIASSTSLPITTPWMPSAGRRSSQCTRSASAGSAACKVCCWRARRLPDRSTIT